MASFSKLIELHSGILFCTVINKRTKKEWEMKSIKIILVFIFYFNMKCADDPEKIQVKLGNLALPNSQQPGPLFGFGQNVIDKGDFQFFTNVDYLKGKLFDSKYNDVAPALLYAFNNHCSVFLAAPFAVQSTFDGRINGIENILVQFEFDLYAKDKLTATDEITFLIAGLLPVGSPCMNPPTGFTAPSIFVGTTASHMAIDWYYFIEFGAIMPVPRKNIKYGDVFLYNFGLGRSIMGNPDNYIFSWLIELNGIYDGNDIFDGVSNPNSGSSFIYVGPSLWLSTKKFILQAGIEFIVYEKLQGIQPPKEFFAALTVGWKFN